MERSVIRFVLAAGLVAVLSAWTPTARASALDELREAAKKSQDAAQGENKSEEERKEESGEVLDTPSTGDEDTDAEEGDGGDEDSSDGESDDAGDQDDDQSDDSE